jgi:uncharacterized protein YwgA
MSKSEGVMKTALLCLALQHFGEIKGRTRLQKILYLANISGWNAFRYMFYQYGPYSDGIKDELDSLVQKEIIEEEEADSYDDKKIYNYTLTPAGEEFAENIVSQIGQPELIEKTQQLFQELSGRTSDDLEIMTSLVFLKKSDPSRTNEKLVSLVKLYKPRFTDDQIKKNLTVFDLLSRFQYA